MGKASSRMAGGEDSDRSVTAADTGNAEATDDETAVSGYRGPALGQGTERSGSVYLSGTGNVTASGGATAVSGYVHTLTVQYALREPAPWPHQVGVIPSPARSFQHRDEADRLRAAVGVEGTAVLSQVLTGMGGVGKTQLAADYARAAWDESGLDVLVWITASTRSAVVSGYAQAGIELCRAAPDDPDRAAKTFLAWLAPKPGQRPCRWLIVLDDVADPGDLIGHARESGSRYSLWPPSSPHGRVLVTTRRRDAALFGEGRRRIEVGLFTPDESVAYLTASLDAQDRSEPGDQLAALASDLGHLPLALSQAAAYLIDSNQTAADYRALLTDRATTLDQLAPDVLPDEQAAACAAAWSLSIDRADTLRPVGLARPMLHLAALLDANGIPRDVLTGPRARAHLAATNLTPEPAPCTQADAVRVLRSLDRLSLIDHTPETPHQAVRIHRLIQRAARDTLTADEHNRAARIAAEALMDAWPTVDSDSALVHALLSNSGALWGTSAPSLLLHGIHPVLFRAGKSLGELGLPTNAAHYHEQLGEAARPLIGERHPDYLTARHGAAFWTGLSGRAGQAAEEFADILAVRTAVLGPDHPDTLLTRHNLARWRGEAGDPIGAVAAYQDLLADELRALGPDHSLTLSTRNNLANWRAHAGDPAAAVDELSQLLADRLRVLGSDHPHTLLTRYNLAKARGESGAPEEAVAELAELLTDWQQVLGVEHPSCLMTRNALANWRGVAGDHHNAVRELRAVYEDRTRVLGRDHPHTQATHQALERWTKLVGASDELAEG
ncbi:tetratricopeptide repeat protein [Streptomyces cellulosae]